MRCALLITTIALTLTNPVWAKDAPQECLNPALNLIHQLSEKQSSRGMGTTVGGSIAGHAAVGAALLGLKGQNLDRPSTEKEQSAEIKKLEDTSPSDLQVAVIDPKKKPRARKGDWSDYLDEEEGIVEDTTHLKPPSKKIKTPKELITEAQAALKLWRENKRVKMGLGSFVIQTELLAEKDKKTAEFTHFNLDKTYKDQVQKILKLTQSENDSQARLESVRKNLYEKYFANYCMALARLANLLKDGCGNCVSQTLLGTSTLIDSNYPIPAGYTLGAQLFSDHIQPVLYSKDKDEVIEIVSGLKLHGVRAPIYSPALFYAEYLKTQNIPIDSKEFLIADANRSSDLGGEGKPKNFGTNALMKFNVGVKDLPEYSSGEPPDSAHGEFKSIHEGSSAPAKENGFAEYGERGEIGAFKRRPNIQQWMSKEEFIEFLSPTSKMARTQAEIRAVNESPTGIAYVHPIGKENRESYSPTKQTDLISVGSAKELEDDKQRRTLFFKNPKEMAAYQSLTTPDKKLSFLVAKNFEALSQIGSTEGYHLLLNYLENPQIISQLSDEEVKKILSAQRSITELNYQFSRARDLFRVEIGFSPTQSTIDSSPLLKQLSEKYYDYFIRQGKNPKASIQFLDRLPLSAKKKFIKLNGNLGGGEFLGIYQYAAEPTRVAIKSLHEEELHLEKVVYINLAGKDDDRYRSTLELLPQGDAEKESGEVPKKTKGKAREHEKGGIPKENPKPNSTILKIRPETMLALILSKRSSGRAGDPARTSRGGMDWVSKYDGFGDYGLEYQNKELLVWQWTPELEEIFEKQFDDGSFDDELVNAVERVHPNKSDMLSGQIPNYFRSKTVVRFLSQSDNRNPDSTLRAKGEDGRYDIYDVDYLLPPKIARAMKRAYEHRFGKDVKITVSDPMEWKKIPMPTPMPIPMPQPQLRSPPRKQGCGGDGNCGGGTPSGGLDPP